MSGSHRGPRDAAATRPLAMTEEPPIVRVKSAGLHPLLFRKRLAYVPGGLWGGEYVRLVDPDDRPAGFGLYNPRAEIAVRMLTRGDEIPDDAWWDATLTRAVQLRREMLGLDRETDSYRVIHAEADGLPGIVVDKLGDVLSAEAFSLGMYQRADEILARLEPLVGTKHRLVRGGPATLPQEGFEGEERASAYLPTRVTIQEFGTRFRVDFSAGHKTGFFCDQRDNRRQLASFCRGKSVLDLCCYTGGFAVQAKVLGEAEEVIGVDLDEQPLQLARENANLNQARVKFAQADAFAYLRDLLRTGRRFDVVVLDPPKLIRSREEFEEGRRKHFDLNRLAMQVVAPGGLLLSCTCAGLLAGDEFTQLLISAARISGEETAPATAERGARHAPRMMQLLAKTGAAPDHPVAGNCPETEYLSAVWMRLW